MSYNFDWLFGIIADFWLQFEEYVWPLLLEILRCDYQIRFGDLLKDVGGMTLLRLGFSCLHHDMERLNCHCLNIHLVIYAIQHEIKNLILQKSRIIIVVIIIHGHATTFIAWSNILRPNYGGYCSVKVQMCALGRRIHWIYCLFRISCYSLVYFQGYFDLVFILDW